jgi:capsule polysaccharide export protein KpsE/RkpR
LDAAEKELTRVRSHYSPENPLFQSSQSAVENLQKQLNEREDAIILGVQAKAESWWSKLDTINKEIEAARRTTGEPSAK